MTEEDDVTDENKFPILKQQWRVSSLARCDDGSTNNSILSLSSREPSPDVSLRGDTDCLHLCSTCANEGHHAVGFPRLNRQRRRSVHRVTMNRHLPHEMVVCRVTPHAAASAFALAAPFMRCRPHDVPNMNASRGDGIDGAAACCRRRGVHASASCSIPAVVSYPCCADTAVSVGAASTRDSTRRRRGGNTTTIPGKSRHTRRQHGQRMRAAARAYEPITSRAQSFISSLSSSDLSCLVLAGAVVTSGEAAVPVRSNLRSCCQPWLLVEQAWV